MARLEIGELTIRVAGISETEARRLGQDVARALAEIPATGERRIGALDLTVPARESAPGDFARTIARRIAEAAS